MIEIVEPQLDQASLCEPILLLLPGWFGIESAIVHYVQEIDRLPTLLAWSQKQVVGFLALKQHNEFAAEIYVMAVHPKSHRQGIGRQLVKVAEAELRKLGVEYFQVKTLGSSSQDPNYAKTRKFYESVGFKPLEEFLNLWEGNPCLQMVKKLPPY
ncbi:gnat family acetyltransferase [Leptolyngbya sp. Heron Island J]|uniref:GNAT family N-acetyltransferase n=1 Tax=Leptolyngbya sp. Heron Island J TaxID=1385935 RepID=UPI0003B9BF67|nr:GNAT family N-acetyltransferase [Leptolyngbya sp. Heron Island J]ESA37408.1 gnat family acetyltransferase [Leptolyngbya sp. Heron Island J]